MDTSHAPLDAFPGARTMVAELQPREPFVLYGPTCDSFDTFPAPFPLPNTIRAGDWIEFGMMGAYSITNRTGFNGFYSDRFVIIGSADSLPPGWEYSS